MRCIPDDPGLPVPCPPRQRSPCYEPPGFEAHGLVRVQRERDGSEAEAGAVDGEDAHLRLAAPARRAGRSGTPPMNQSRKSDSSRLL